MKNIFFSPTENILFWIAGYDTYTHNVQQKVSSMIANCETFSNIANVPYGEVYMLAVTTKSSRYQGAEVYYAETATVPEGAFDIGENWTMNQWLER